MVHSTSSSNIAKASIHEGIIAADGITVNVAEGIHQVSSASPNTTAMFIFSLLALLVNAAVFVYMIYKVRKTRRNPYTGELYSDLSKYQEVKVLAE